jgi:hypothetical protein
VRVRGRVRRAGTTPGWVYLQLGESEGRMVSVFVREDSWKTFGLRADALAGRTLTAQGVLSLEQGKFLNIAVDHAAQLTWEK